MFLTRIGFGSKVVVTGDVTQVDVPGGRSGLARPRARSSTGIDGLAFVHLTSQGRRAPPHRAGHRRRLRAGDAAASRPVTPTELPHRSVAAGDDADVRRRRRRRAPRSRARSRCSCADEQAADPVDVARWVAPGRRRARGRGRAGRRRAVAAVRRRGDDRRAQPAVHGRGRPDRRARLPDRRRPVEAGRWPDAGTHAAPTATTPEPGDLPLLLGDVVICPAVAGAQRAGARRHLRRRARAARRARHPPRPRHGPRRRRRRPRHAGPRARAARPSSTHKR